MEFNARIRRLVNLLIPGMPRVCISDARAWIKTQMSPADRQRGYLAPMVQEKYPAEILTRKRPNTITEKIHGNFCRQTFNQSPRCAVFFFPNARILGREGYILSEDGGIFEEFTYCQKGPTRDYNLFYRLKMPVLQKLPGIWATIAYPDAGEFFHFEVECLPRLHLIEEFWEVLDGLLVPRNLRDNHVKVLAELGFSKEKLVFLEENSHWKPDQLVVPGYMAGKNLPPWVPRFLQEKLPSQIRTDSPRRVYISREDARWRHVRNEAELLDLLNPLGFYKARISDMSPSEQRELFYNAEIILAPHGAALTNLMYCKPGTTFIELFSPHHVDVTYWTICNANGLKYWYLLGDVTPRSVNKADFEDILVSITDLEKILHSVLISNSSGVK